MIPHLIIWSSFLPCNYLLLLFSCSLMSNPLWPHGPQHTRLLCPSLSPGVCSDSCPLGLIMPSNHLILCCPLTLMPSMFPSIRIFSSESALHIRWSKYWSFSFTISIHKYDLRQTFLFFVPLLKRGKEEKTKISKANFIWICYISLATLWFGSGVVCSTDKAFAFFFLFNWMFNCFVLFGLIRERPISSINVLYVRMDIDKSETSARQICPQVFLLSTRGSISSQSSVWVCRNAAESSAVSLPLTFPGIL